MTAPQAMPPRVRAWLDYELEYAAHLAGRAAAKPERYVEGPSVDELCAALPLAADQLERVKILGELRSELYNGDDLLIGELYLAAQQHPERMDHMYDYVFAASSVRKELGPEVVNWLRELGEFGEGVDMDTAQVMVRALHMEEDWDELTRDWEEVPALAQRTVWHDGHWRHKDQELVPLHRAEFSALVEGVATAEQLAAWKAEPRTWPRPVKTDAEGPWVVAEEWRQFIRLKLVDDTSLAEAAAMSTAREERLARHLKAAQERADRLQEEYDEAAARSQRLGAEHAARTGPVMTELPPEHVESSIDLDAAGGHRA